MVRVIQLPSDVKNYDEISILWKLNKSRFGKIDIWINNAGISNEQAPSWEISVDEMRSVIETNILGELFGTKVAMQGFLDQGFGAIYNVEGLITDGEYTPGTQAASFTITSIVTGQTDGGGRR